MTGIILSGGKNTRMDGKNKAFLDFHGERLIERTLRLFRCIFEDIILVTNSPLEYMDQDVRIVTDIVKGKGALGGIYTGLFFASSSHAFVTACDMPFLSMPFIEYMILHEGSCDVLVPETEAGLQPLHAVYSKRCLRDIKKRIEADSLKVTGIYEKLRVTIVSEEKIRSFDPGMKMFLNVNSPDDMKELNT